jgi:hypothetical protein
VDKRIVRFAADLMVGSYTTSGYTLEQMGDYFGAEFAVDRYLSNRQHDTEIHADGDESAR